MARISGTAGSKDAQTPSAPVFRLSRLSDDSIRHVFSNLHPSELLQDSLDKKLKSFAIEAANLNAASSIDKFIQLLIRGLDPKIFPAQIGSLTEISQNLPTANYVNLSEIKEYVLGVKKPTYRRNKNIGY